MDTVRFSESHLILRNLSKTFPVISHGKGVYLYDKAGNEYLDGSSGAFVASIGHANDEVAKAIYDQLKHVGYVNGTQFVCEKAIDLAERLAVLGKPLGLSHSTFLTSGSEAVEAAVKLARQYQVELGHHKRTKFIARTPSYHGNTFFALSASGRPHYKKLFGPLLHTIPTVSTPYEYRSPVQDFHRDATAYYVQELEELIAHEGEDTLAGFLIEPVSGSSCGGATPPMDYLNALHTVCKRHGILMIADEVLVGSGRTGKFFASEHYNFKPEILVLGKGISGGMAPLSAVMTTHQIFETIRKGSGNFSHAQTFMQHPVCTAAAVATLKLYEEQKLLENCQNMGFILHKELRDAIGDHPNVGFISGVGLILGIEFVEDRNSKKPFARTQQVTEKITAACFRNGLVVWPNTGHVDGKDGDLILIGPPLIIDQSEMDDLRDRLVKAIHEALPE